MNYLKIKNNIFFPSDLLSLGSFFIRTDANKFVIMNQIVIKELS